MKKLKPGKLYRTTMALGYFLNKEFFIIGAHSIVLMLNPKCKLHNESLSLNINKEVLYNCNVLYDGHVCKLSHGTPQSDSTVESWFEEL